MIGSSPSVHFFISGRILEQYYNYLCSSLLGVTSIRRLNLWKFSSSSQGCFSMPFTTTLPSSVNEIASKCNCLKKYQDISSHQASRYIPMYLWVQILSTSGCLYKSATNLRLISSRARYPLASYSLLAHSANWRSVALQRISGSIPRGCIHTSLPQNLELGTYKPLRY